MPQDRYDANRSGKSSRSTRRSNHRDQDRPAARSTRHDVDRPGRSDQHRRAARCGVALRGLHRTGRSAASRRCARCCAGMRPCCAAILRERRSSPGKAIRWRVALQAVTALEDSYLFVQGPPGAGKTTIGSQLILGLLREGKRVGVASNSHKVINNLLKAVEERADEEGFAVHRRQEIEQAGPRERVRRPVHRGRVCQRRPRSRCPADRRHRMALRRSATRSEPRLPVRRRGRAGLARQPRRDGHVGAQHRPARRPDAARAADPGRASGPLGRVDAGIPARRTGDGRGRSRHLSRHDVAHARGRVPLHFGRGLRRTPRARARQPEPAPGAERFGARSAAADGDSVLRRSTRRLHAEQQGGSGGREGHVRKSAGPIVCRQGGQRSGA